MNSGKERECWRWGDLEIKYLWPKDMVNADETRDCSKGMLGVFVGVGLFARMKEVAAVLISL